MAKKSQGRASRSSSDFSAAGVSSPVEQLLLAALERGDDSFQTGRYLVTYKEGAAEAGAAALGARGLRMASARDFKGQAAALESAGDADALDFPEIGVALLGGAAAEARGMAAAGGVRTGEEGVAVAEAMELAADGPIESIDPEYFVFPASYLSEFGAELGRAPGAGGGIGGGMGGGIGGGGTGGGIGGGMSGAGGGGAASQYLRGFMRATETILKDLEGVEPAMFEIGEEATAVGVTWGLRACRVPQSVRSGAGIKVAVLDTGMDLGHPDFLGRAIFAQQFVGQPVQDLHSHGTHCIGTACGPKSPAGTTPRYGIAYRSPIFVGKVLSNSGGSVGGSVLAGMNWAIANRCQVISMSLGGPGGPHPAYTAAGQAALNNGLLIIAAAGNSGGPTGAPANSPTIMSVASLDPNLAPSNFSSFGKVDIAGPGRDVFSSVPRPLRYGTKSGTSMATPHVAGCAALWAESSASLRGMALWRRLQATARRLPFPFNRVGAGLVQAP